jgi:hypothetical protein
VLLARRAKLPEPSWARGAVVAADSGSAAACPGLAPPPLLASSGPLTCWLLGCGCWLAGGGAACCDWLSDIVLEYHTCTAMAGWMAALLMRHSLMRRCKVCLVRGSAENGRIECLIDQ